MRRPTAILCSTIALLLSAALPAASWGHGAVAELYRTRILELSPDGVPVDVSIKGDQIRFENQGDEELVVCGYAAERCEEWVRIRPDGVFVDENSEAFHANADGSEQGDVPEDAGEGGPRFERVRKAPPFYAYHDHRVHWMGGEDVLPPNVDETDPEPQRVFDGRVEFRYGDTDGFVRTRLEYVGGRTWLQRYGEYALTGAAVVFMLGFFAFDARRRRRRAAVAA